MALIADDADSAVGRGRFIARVDAGLSTVPSEPTRRHPLVFSCW